MAELPNKLLDKQALLAIKDYVDAGDAASGKINDVQVNGTTVVSDKVANIAVDGTYNSSTNKIASQSTVTSAINALDVSNITGFGTGKTLATLTETDGKIAATFQDIQLASTAKVTGLDTALGNKVDKKTTTGTFVYTHNGSTQGEVAYSTSATASNIVQRTTGGQVTVPTTPSADSDATSKNYVDTGINTRVPNTRTIAGIDLADNITSSELITALGLQQAMSYIGVATTTKPTAGQYVQTVIGSTTYYVSLTTSGTATQVNATKGQILTIGTKEYICTTAGASGTNVFSELGDESSYALKTITVTGTGALGGGGNLSTNRTITHNAGNAPSKTSGFYKFSTDAYSHISSVTAVAKADLTGLGVADDSAVVHKTGNEQINGNKTFLQSITINGSTDYAIYGSRSITLGTGSSSPSVALTFPSTTGTLALTSQIPSVADYVKGPSSATDNAIAIYNGTTGKVIKNTKFTLTETTASGDVTTGILAYNNSDSGGNSFKLSFVGNNTSSIELKYDASLVPSTNASGGIGSLGTSSNKWTTVYVDSLSNGTKSATVANIADHLANTTIHVTGTDKAKWDGYASGKISSINVNAATESTAGSVSATYNGSPQTIIGIYSYNEALGLLQGTNS